VNYVVSVRNLGMKYHSLNGEIDALQNINFSVSEGEFISIVDQAAAVNRHCCRLLQDSWPQPRERYWWTANLFRRLPTRWIYAAKRPSFEWRTIYQNVILGPEIRRTLNQETKEYALKLLATYGLYEFKDKYPSQLRGNEAKSGSYKNPRGKAPDTAP